MHKHLGLFVAMIFASLMGGMIVTSFSQPSQAQEQAAFDRQQPMLTVDDDPVTQLRKELATRRPQMTNLSVKLVSMGFHTTDCGQWVDSQGYDLWGYNQDGFNRFGLNRQGLDANGRNARGEDCRFSPPTPLYGIDPGELIWADTYDAQIRPTALSSAN
jgi:hypothetical protein